MRAYPVISLASAAWVGWGLAGEWHRWWVAGSYSSGVAARPRFPRSMRALAVAVATVSAATACATAAPTLEPTEALGAVVTPAPTATPSVQPTATPRPTPTPLPTPTPTPEPVIATDLLRSSIDENFVALDELGVSYGFAVYADSVGYLEERGADDRLLPASNQKIVTAMGAFELLDPDFRFVTEMRIDADGTVYIVGGGDPTFTTAHAETLVAALVTYLAARPSAPEQPQETAEPEESEETGEEVDEGDGGGAEGEPAPEPTPTPEPVAPTVGDVVVDPSYFSATRLGPGWPDRYLPVDAGPMSGLMIDDNQHRGDAAYLAAPDVGNAELFADLMADAGIVVSGVPRVGEVPAGTDLVGQRRSPSVAAMVDVILGRSDNEIAEALVRQIGVEYRDDSEIGVGKAVVYQRVAELGLDLGDPVGDGSGLSRDNRLSAGELIDTMVLATERPWWPMMLDGFADAGQGGTLADRFETDTTRGNVSAKTGTLFDTVALSGVLTTVDGVELYFSFLINGVEAERARDHMDQIIVAYASATLPQLLE